MSLQKRIFPRRENGTHEVVAKPSPVPTRQPKATDQEKKKGSLTSSLRMDPHSRSGKSRKSTKLRSISRSLMLCNAKTSDDGSSPDEKYPDPFETSLGQSKEGIFHSSVQLADTSEAGRGSVPDLALASEATGSDRGKSSRRIFFMKVCLGLVGLEESVVALGGLNESLNPFILRSGRHRVLILNKSKKEVEAGLPGMIIMTMVMNQAQLTFSLERVSLLLGQWGVSRA
uniref:Uncharacterized protein n=1 Tax=Canis lupus dingo TaxID=286419 RepID=A0A8C0KTI7_CANLU